MAERNAVTDRWVEDRLTLDYVIIPACSSIPGTPGTPGTPADPGETLLGLVEDQLPRPTPTISGGRAITGLRSWVDLGRPGTWELVDSVEDFGALGDLAVTATGAVTAVIDWGDGTVTEHVATAGGGYREGEPGPGDVTHTYVDTGSRTISIVDTWELTFRVEGIAAPITLSATLDPVTFDVGVTEVRSVGSRDD